MMRKIVVCVVGLMFLYSCSDKNRFNIDLTGIEVSMEIKRLDKEIFEIDPDSISTKLPYFVNKYGEFFELYSTQVIKLGSPGSLKYPENLKGFITDFTMNKVHDKVMEVFPDVNSLQSEISDAFKRFKYYFPEKKIPALYTYIGGFNQSIVIADSILGIGVDKYLGEDCEFYDRLGFANYLQKNMNPENISADVLRAWALTEFEYNDEKDNLVSNMIYQGKMYYFLDAIFPNVSDSLKIGFTAAQLQWCVHNKKQMWNYLIDQKLLFSTDYMTINKHINPAPFTSGYPNESPGRASVWLGWQIIKAYMGRHKDISLKDLMLDDDYQKILTESKYQP